jgi:hypothetical protein
MPDTLLFIGVLYLIKMHSGICLHFAKVVGGEGGGLGALQYNGLNCTKNGHFTEHSLHHIVGAVKNFLTLFVLLHA